MCYGRWHVKGPAPRAATTELVTKPGLLLSRPPSTSMGRVRGTRQGELQTGTSGVGETVAPSGLRRSRIWLMHRPRDGPYEDRALLERHRAVHSSPSQIEGLHRPNGPFSEEYLILFCICELFFHRGVPAFRAWEISAGEVLMAHET